MEHAPAWLVNSLIYLAAAVISVPLAKKLGLGSIIGYLAAGIAIGPWGLGLVTNVQDILHFAEFGVVLMLFLIGLELEPKRLWNLRRPIFGWGSAQVLGCAALLTGVAMEGRHRGPRSGDDGKRDQRRVVVRAVAARHDMAAAHQVTLGAPQHHGLALVAQVDPGAVARRIGQHKMPAAPLQRGVHGNRLLERPNHPRKAKGRVKFCSLLEQEFV